MSERIEKKKIGIVGWRGMVGSVLISRMTEEKDFDYFDPIFFSTSQAGLKAPNIPGIEPSILLDAYSVEELSKLPAVISCQGGDYTKKIHSSLRESGWKGFWIDAASALRTKDSSCLILDPVNGDKIKSDIEKGVRDLIGGNCTVSLLLMGLAPLFKEGLVEWMSTMTYQAASGAGAKHMKELLEQMGCISGSISDNLENLSALELDKLTRQCVSSSSFPTDNFNTSLALSLIPYIDSEVENGMSREEWKGQFELNKFFDFGTEGNPLVRVDGICVRVPVLRSHAQAFTIKLSKNVSVQEVEDLLAKSHDWIDVVPNKKDETVRRLSPLAVSGSLKVAVGRLRKMTLGEEFLTGFTVGDQLLWGAAEPLRRIARIIHPHL